MKFFKSKKHLSQGIKAATSKDFLFTRTKLLLECWNAERPHFGGDGPHRYDDNSKECCYCGRPRDWKPTHPGFGSEEIIEALRKVKGDI